MRAHLADVKALAPLRGDVDEVFPFFCAFRALDGRHDELLSHLANARIQAWVHCVPNHLQPAFRAADAELPVSERLYLELISLRCITSSGRGRRPCRRFDPGLLRA